MDRTTMDLWVGLFVAAGIVALIGLAMKVGNLTSDHLGDTYTVSAHFDDIGGLKPRAPIKSAGVVVGRVDSIQFDSKRYDAVVKLKIDKSYKFPKDTFASINTSGLLGEQYVTLEAGGDTEMLEEDGKGKIEHTQPALVLEKLIGQFVSSKAEGDSSTPQNTMEDAQ
ncbi:MAG: outer membrane lipid asymmetry maintenance protein MlaD [Methylobacillus sp.]|nr:outer membrane lipid asymmetry maintenance protein MlaD [Methylobacillus sp.]